MITFNDLEFKPHPMGVGILARAEFDNEWGVTVVKTPYTYGGDRDLYELAVWNFTSRSKFTRKIGRYLY